VPRGRARAAVYPAFFCVRAPAQGRAPPPHQRTFSASAPVPRPSRDAAPRSHRNRPWSARP
jgi:hypothetical protein